MTILGTSILSGGQATLTTKSLPAGSRSLRAYYSGSSSASVAQTVFALPQNGFRATSVVDAGISAPAFVAVGDFNGDGIPDLVTLAGSTSNAGTISIQLGKGDGTFQATVTYNAGALAQGPTGFLAVGDFNADGKADLAVSGVNLGVLLGNGDGTFQAMVNIAAIGGPMAVADFNGDGRADIVVLGGSNFSTLSVFLGNGDGTFQPSLNSDGQVAFNFVVADFNGDGIPDLVISGIETTPSFGNVAVVLGKGDGTFGPPTIIASLKGGASVAVGDFNGDGKPDVAESGPPFGNLAIILGNGDGTFQPPFYGSGVSSLSTGAIVTGDFNGDGKIDLAINSGNGIGVMIGNGNGGFQSPVYYLYSSGCGGFRGANNIAVGDLNGDGVSDLVAAVNEGCTKVNLLAGTPAAAAPRPVAGSVVTAANYQSFLALGMIATVFGTNLSPVTANAIATPLPTELSGVSLSANGILAPLLYVSPTQINFQVPWDFVGQSRPIIVTVNGSSSVAATINSLAASPGIFTLNASGTGQGAIQIANTGILATTSRPARRGEFLSIYCSGLGDVSPRPATGAAASDSPASGTVLTPSVTIGGVQALVTFSGLAPGFAGLYQVNVQVPDGAPTGAQVQVAMSIGGFTSNVVTIAIQ